MGYFVTSQDKFSQSKFVNYLQFVLSNLSNPDELWTHSYENQIKEEDRFLITTLFSFGEDIEHSVLEKAFEYRIKYEVKKNGYQRPNDVFNSSVKRLIDGFISRYQSYGGQFEFSFANPSIGDFLISYLKKSKTERWRLLESCLYIEQYENIFNALILDFSDYKEFINEAIKFIDTIKSRHSIGISGKLKKILDENTYLKLKKAYLFSYASRFDEIKEKTEPLIYSILISIDFKGLYNYRYIELVKYIMIGRIEEGLLEKYFISNWDDTINILFKCAIDLSDCESIMEIFESYSIDFYSYSSKKSNKHILRSNIERIADMKTDDAISSEKSYLKSDYDFEGLKDRIGIYRSEIFEKVGLTDYGFDEGFYFDGIDEVFFKENTRKDKKKRENLLHLETKSDTHFTEKDIDDLFYIETRPSKTKF